MLYHAASRVLFCPALCTHHCCPRCGMGCAGVLIGASAQVPHNRFTSDRAHQLPSVRAAQVAAAEAYKEELRLQIEEDKRRKVPRHRP